MFVLALAGVLHLNSVWVNHIAPEIRTHVSAAVFSVIASAVNKAFCCKALFGPPSAVALPCGRCPGPCER